MLTRECQHAIGTSLFGAYNRALGGNLNDVMAKHEPMLRERLKNELNMDIKTILQ